MPDVDDGIRLHAAQNAVHLAVGGNVCDGPGVGAEEVRGRKRFFRRHHDLAGAAHLPCEKFVRPQTGSIYDHGRVIGTLLGEQHVETDGRGSLRV